MKKKVEQFVQVPYSVFRGDLTPMEICLWLELRTYQQGNFLSNSALARNIGCSERHITQLIKSLEEKNYLEKTPSMQHRSGRRLVAVAPPYEEIKKKRFFEDTAAPIIAQQGHPLTQFQKEEIERQWTLQNK